MRRFPAEAAGLAALPAAVDANPDDRPDRRLARACGLYRQVKIGGTVVDRSGTISVVDFAGRSCLAFNSGSC